MNIHPYLSFDGRCGEAFRLYERVLGGKIDFMQTYGESPMADQTPAELRDAVMHATLRVGDTLLMGSDAPPGHFQKPQGTHISVTLRDATEGARIFDELSEGGSVTMPFEKTFWAEGAGMVTDRFGTPWIINGARVEF
jgi:PhnB protein